MRAKDRVFQLFGTLAESGRVRSVVPKLALSLVIAVAFFWLLRTGALPMFPPLHAFAKVTWWAVGGYALLNCLATFLRTYRWLHLLRPMRPNLSARRVFGIGLVGFAAVLFAPLRTGEIVRPWLLARDGEVSFMQAGGTVAAERIIDGLMLTVILMWSLLSATPISPLPDRLGSLALPVSVVPNAAKGALLMFSCAFIALALFYFWRTAARRLVHLVFNPISERLATFLTTRVEQLADGLRFLPSRTHAGRFVRDSLVYWAVCALSLWLLLYACGAHATFVEACVTMGIMGIGTLIPSGPGFFGVHQLAAYCALAMFFPEPVVLTSGAVFTFVSYTTQIVVTAAGCGLGFWIMENAPVALPVTSETSASAEAGAG